ncbi:hypothetical protein FKP32DRAFT_1134198 [Trametes sanguinea]|nr:hypothetical protein FKP32DRAFT_1134198 [Trametes sanguinea]
MTPSGHLSRSVLVANVARSQGRNTGKGEEMVAPRASVPSHSVTSGPHRPQAPGMKTTDVFQSYSVSGPIARVPSDMWTTSYRTSWDQMCDEVSRARRGLAEAQRRSQRPGALLGRPRGAPHSVYVLYVSHLRRSYQGAASSGNDAARMATDSSSCAGHETFVCAKWPREQRGGLSSGNRRGAGGASTRVPHSRLQTGCISKRSAVREGSPRHVLRQEQYVRGGASVRRRRAFVSSWPSWPNFVGSSCS